MEGRHIAVFATTLIWIVGYFISIFYFSQKFSSGIIPSRLREKTNLKKMSYFMVVLPFVSSILAGLLYRIGGILEKGNGIAWGCYIEDFWLGTIFLWAISLICLFFLLVISLIKPNLYGFQDRKRALAFYFIHHLYTLLLLIIIELLIPILSGPLTGKDSSCL
jgi:hypothetical protein